MKILVSSFDKILIERLNATLKNHSVSFVRNGEDALRHFDGNVDLIIYDAVSGVVSEHELNSMYEKGYSKQKYIILIDELFPIDPDNLKIKDKYLLSRDKEISLLPEIINKIKESQDQKKEENTTKEVIMHALNKALDYKEQKKEESINILVISLDEQIIDDIKNSLKDFNIMVVSPKDITDNHKKESDIIIYDTTPGSIAAKELLHNFNNYQEKIFVLILDDIFPVDISRLPLKYKYGILRQDIKDNLGHIISNLVNEFGLKKAEKQNKEDQLMDNSKLNLKELIIEVIKDEIKTVIKESLSNINFKELATNSIMSQINSEEIKNSLLTNVNQAIDDMKHEVVEMAKKEIEEALKKEDIEKIVREITYSILQDRVKEILL